MLSRNFQSILVVNPYGIGDALFTTPIIHTLKENFPQGKIDVLIGSRTREIFEHNPDLCEIIVFDKGRFDKSNFVKKIDLLTTVFKKLKNRRYDLIIDLSNAPEYGFFGKFLLKIPLRVGFDYKRRGRFLTRRIPLEGFEGKHIVEFYLDLLRELKIPIRDNHLHLYVSKENEKWAKDFLIKNNIKDTDLVIGIVPGGGASWGKNSYLKHWPIEYFERLSEFLIEKLKAKILLFGSDTEANLCKRINDFLKGEVVDTSGKLNIAQLTALFKRCNLIICNDGGPLHIAKTQEVNTISIFGPVNSKVYGPYPKTNKDIVLETEIACRPCYKNFRMPDCKTKDCLRTISPEMVFERAKSLILKQGDNW
ncbi:MAG: lipopolysaccharide heptosyltransferase II [Candidatus Omnitrophica bacterium]|nr:lipopolysaccharide heptosyltransferase II [Candidatus Omnitrophota bacterium]